MLSYRHSYHAGNFADVIKHFCLVEILAYLTQKDKPLCYIDTHSGAGAYNLLSSQADKNKEYLNGIAKLYQNKDLPAELQRYCDLIKRFNHSPNLTAYPGSPWLAQQLLRANDRLFFCELHNQEVQILQQNFAQDKRIKVRHEDGLNFFQHFLPSKEKRALVLIDPSYEIKTDYQAVTDSLIAAHKRFASGCYALWYPVVERELIKQMEKRLIKSGISNILLAEISLQKDNQKGMSASGMIIINPPYTLQDTLQKVLPDLTQALAANAFRCQMLA